jgi:hypothetical protein
VNFVLADDTLSPKDMQALARHGTLDMTVGRYGTARADRMRQAAERIADRVGRSCATVRNRPSSPKTKKAQPPCLQGAAPLR